MKYESKIYVAGHNGLVGSAIVRSLIKSGYTNLILKSSKELNLERQTEVEQFFCEYQPEYVFLVAAKVGGINANNKYPAEFIYKNLMIQSNVINTSLLYGVKKLLFLGSSCIYPKESKQPIKEEYLFDGKLEPTNEAYALAKIAGIRMCSFYRKQYNVDFISAMPTNLYGINDNFDLETSHVLPAIIRKIHEAKKNNQKNIILWGTGEPKREFLYVDDLADACIFLMLNYSSEEHINIGTGKDISIFELAHKIMDIINYKGEIIFDKTKPNGTMKKVLDVNRINELGWSSKTSLEEGIKITYNWFKKSVGENI